MTPATTIFSSAAIKRSKSQHNKKTIQKAIVNASLAFFIPIVGTACGGNMSQVVPSQTLPVSKALTPSSLHLKTIATSMPPIVAYVTTYDQKKLFSQDITVPQFSTATPPPGTSVITVSPSTMYQIMAGFGAALTGSAVYNIKNMSDGGTALLSALFKPSTGIGLSYVRLTMGASDFSSHGNYSYDDMPTGQTDTTLAGFSTSPDADAFSMVGKIHTISSGVSFMATPWSAPAWMKGAKATMDSGDLLSTYYTSYAQYFVKYDKALAALGVNLDMFTPQNEPLNNTSSYPAEGFAASEEDTFIKSYLSPALKAANLSTKLTVYDHNWDQPSYPETLLADATTNPLIAGTAWHCYAGDPSAMTTVHNAYPNKDNYFTECSGTGDNNSGFAGNLSWNMEHLIIGGPNNWAKTVLFWNLALDANSGPTNNGCTNCRGVVTINSDGSVTKNVEYYLLEHLTRFVLPGSVRIGSSTIENVINTAYQNTDGSRTLVAFNQGLGNATFAICDRSKFVTYTLPQGAAVTFHW